MKFKFRYWNGYEMIGWRDIEDGYYYMTALNDKDYPMMQYTGINDQNGLEIYESDLIQWWDPLNGGLQKGIVEFLNGSFGVMRGFAFVHLGNIYKSGLITVDGKDIRTLVLGSIYQNPELVNVD